MEPNYTLRMIIIIGLLVGNAFYIFNIEKPSKFECVLLTWGMSYTGYFALKEMFDF